MKKLSRTVAAAVLAGCGEKQSDAWLGYGEGDNAFIAAPQPGWVTAMKVQRGQMVHRGDPLFLLDDTREQAGRDQASAALAQARASLSQEQSNLDYTRTELGRQDRLATRQAGTPTQHDLALANFRQSNARIAQLKAQIAQMEAALTNASYGLSQREVVAQTDGPVQDIYFREGEYVPASTPGAVAAAARQHLCPLLRARKPAVASPSGPEACASPAMAAHPMNATISFIAAREEFTPPVIFSVGNREKLVFKLEARAPGGLKLNPGQPVEVRPL